MENYFFFFLSSYRIFLFRKFFVKDYYICRFPSQLPFQNLDPKTSFPYSKRTFLQIKLSSIIVSNRRVYSVVLFQGYGLNYGEPFPSFLPAMKFRIYSQFPRQKRGNFRLNFISAVVVSNLKLYHASITGKLSLGFPFPLLQVEFHDSMEFQKFNRDMYVHICI